MSEIESLRQEVAELRRKVGEADEWANSIQEVLAAALPFLLRGHPEAGKVAESLRHHGERFELLLNHPDLAENEDETAGLYESGKLLYRQLARLGVWPGADPARTP